MASESRIFWEKAALGALIGEAVRNGGTECHGCLG